MTLPLTDTIDEREVTMTTVDTIDEPVVDDALESPDAQDDSTPIGEDRSRGRILVYVILPALVLALALGVGYLKWQTGSIGAGRGEAAAAVAAATEATTAMLSYRADHVEEDLTAASERMTGEFRSEYTTLINDVVIPGAQQKRISAVATVPAAAVLSAEADRAQVMVYVNQTITMADGRPTDSTSAARVDLERVGNKWLLTKFEPI